MSDFPKDELLDNLSVVEILLYLGIRLVKQFGDNLLVLLCYTMLGAFLFISILKKLWICLCDGWWSEESISASGSLCNLAIGDEGRTGAIGCVIRKTQLILPNDTFFQPRITSKMAKILHGIVNELQSLPQQKQYILTPPTMEVQKIFLMFPNDSSDLDGDRLLCHMKYVDLDFNHAWNSPKEMFTKNRDINLRFFSALNYK